MNRKVLQGPEEGMYRLEDGRDARLRSLVCVALDAMNSLTPEERHTSKAAKAKRARWSGRVLDGWRGVRGRFLCGTLKLYTDIDPEGERAPCIATWPRWGQVGVKVYSSAYFTACWL